MTEHDHARGVADEDDVDARPIDETRERRVVRGHHRDPLSVALHRDDVGDGELLRRRRGAAVYGIVGSFDLLGHRCTSVQAGYAPVPAIKAMLARYEFREATVTRTQCRRAQRERKAYMRRERRTTCRFAASCASLDRRCSLSSIAVPSCADSDATARGRPRQWARSLCQTFRRANDARVTPGCGWTAREGASPRSRPRRGRR